jgi:tetratricopeptide (TPR) repeat protein
MQTAAMSSRILAILGFAITTLILARPAAAQPGPPSETLQHATQLIRDGKTTEALAAVRKELETNPTSRQAANLLDVLGETRAAREVFQRAIDAASDAGAKAAAQRSMAMSFAFDADCANTIKYEEEVIDYWKTREQADPQNAFYQQGEMANEAARVCIDSGDLDAAERMYRRGSELGLKEPGHQTHPRSLWDYRLAHALGRIAARRGNAAEARKQVDAARAALDGDPKMAEQQERFFPYLVGYVALYTNDLPAAEVQLTKALQSRGNENDPFMHALLGMTYEKLGHAARAKGIYEKAYALATSHNPPAAFTRRLAREKLSATQ